MTASPVTVQELLDALSTYPPDAHLLTCENGYGGGSIRAKVDDAEFVVWSGVTSADNWLDPENVPFNDERPRSFKETR